MYLFLIEAISVGLITALFGTLTGIILAHFFKINILLFGTVKEIIATEVMFFLTGFLIHTFCEISGINKWYCANGFACLR